ncbi:MAG: C4-type zinc ribbon domain-containing protein [Candidatus Eisenbacteria bacterium]
MQDQVAVLIELRQVDDRLQTMRAKAEARAADLQRLQKEADAVRASLAQEQAKLAQAQRSHREANAKIEDCRLEKVRAEKALGNVKNNDQYQASLREIASMEQKAREWEDVVLELMEVEEAAQRTIARIAAEVKEKENVAGAEGARLDENLRVLKGQEGELGAARLALIERLGPQVRSKYDRLTAAKGDAIVPVLRGSCGGCHYNLPPQTVNEVRQKNRMILCEGCGRILIWPGD